MKAAGMRALFVAAVLLCAPAVTWSAPPQGYVQNEGISSGEAAERVRAQYGGRVISVTPANRGGQQGYTVRVLVEGGRVKTVFVDARGSVRGSR